VKLRCIVAADLRDKDEDEEDVPGKPIRVERLLANLGYGLRKEAQDFVRRGRAKRKDGKKLKIGEKVLHTEVLMDDEPLDRPFPITILLHKPVGYVVTAPDDERIPDPKVYDLLPHR
jgi:16S rRNA pseudouridine516 synthase